MIPILLAYSKTTFSESAVTATTLIFFLAFTLHENDRAAEVVAQYFWVSSIYSATIKPSISGICKSVRINS